MRRAILAWLTAAASGRDAHAATVAAAEAVADRPWDVVHHAGLLARCTRAVAARDLGLTRSLREVRPDAPDGIVRVDAGQPYPSLDRMGRRTRGAYDTPAEMARRVVGAAIRACDPAPRVGLDPACGTGAFLLAMAEAGVPEVWGTDLDETALAVASIAVPSARVIRASGLEPGPQVDLVCGNPPFVPPERQDKALRLALRRRYPWLHGRFDLVVPFAASAADRVRVGGGVGLVLPASALVQPYGAALRRLWLSMHRFTKLSPAVPFPGASVHVAWVTFQVGCGPGPLPSWGVSAEEVLRLSNAPLDPELRPGDIALIEHIRASSVPLGSLAEVDTGVVAHGPDGGKRNLLFDEPGEGRVPYADARDFFAGRRTWLWYRPDRMHRAKRPDLFEGPKIVVQRLRGRGLVRAAIDLDGVYVGHTCTVIVPRDPRVSIERLLDVVQSPIVDGVTRVESGQRLDLYPRDVAGFPVPRCWLEGSAVSIEEGLGLRPADVERIERALAR